MKVGTTSFILPDTWIANAEFLAGRVDNIELLIFESECLPSTNEIEALGRIPEQVRSKKPLTYTVHLPVDLPLFAKDGEIRRRSVKKMETVIKQTLPLDPEGWILHLTQEEETMPVLPSYEDLNEIFDLLSGIVAPEKICMENLTGDNPEEVANRADRSGISFCYDIGHHLQNGSSNDIRWLVEKARIIHLHGIDRRKKDHCGIEYLDKETIEIVAEAFHKREEKILTIEVFNKKDWENSMEVWKEITQQ